MRYKLLQRTRKNQSGQPSYFSICENEALMRSPFAGMLRIHRAGFERTGRPCEAWRRVLASRAVVIGALASAVEQ